MTQGLRMIVEPDYHRNIDPLGDWDGTWDESFVYVIYDAYGYQEARRGGFHTEEQAGSSREE